MDTNKKIPADVTKKELTYDEKVVKKIAGIATEGVQGIIAVSGGLVGNITDKLRTDDKTKGIDADVGKHQVALDLNVVCEYGKHVPGLFDAVVEKVSKAVFEMTGLEVIEVNMHVEDVLRKDEFNTLLQKQHASKDSDSTQMNAGEMAPPSQAAAHTSRVQ